MKKNLISFALLATLMLSGCAETQLISHWAKNAAWPGTGESKGKYKVGNPYKVGSVWYYPQESFGLVETGIASWYGPGFHADHTANGEIFDQNELTAAHRTLQLPSIVRVTNLENGRSVVVRVNDRGPFLHGRIMDVSKRAAELLGFANKGVARVRIEVQEKESRILAEAAKRGEDTTRLTYADLRERTPQQATRVAAVAPAAGGDDVATPESLQTPSITVEELKSPGSSASVDYQTPPNRVIASAAMVPGQMKAGRFMPAPVVENAPVSPTGLFVQAGSFAVYDNAQKLSQKLSAIAPSSIEPVTVGGRQLYRVKLGPIPSVEKADRVLEQVIRAGEGTARVVKKSS